MEVRATVLEETDRLAVVMTFSTNNRAIAAPIKGKSLAQLRLFLCGSTR